MPRLLRHSPLFLIGCFPIALTAWAWCDSMQTFRDWNYCRDPLNSYWIESEASKLSVGWRKAEKLRSDPILDGHPASELFVFVPFKFRQPFGDFRRRPVELTPGEGWFPRPGLVRYSNPMVASLREDVTHTARISYWLILACYIPLWIGASYWQVRRIRRHLETSLQPHGAASAASSPDAS
jgi:hypothetical protein